MNKEEIQALITQSLTETTGIKEVTLVTKTAEKLGNGNGYYTIQAYMRTVFSLTPTSVIAMLVHDKVLIKIGSARDKGESKLARQKLAFYLKPHFVLGDGYALSPEFRDKEENKIFRPASTHGKELLNSPKMSEDGQTYYERDGVVKWYVDANNKDTERYFRDLLIKITHHERKLRADYIIEANKYTATNDLAEREALKEELSNLDRKIKLFSPKIIHLDFEPLDDDTVYM